VIGFESPERPAFTAGGKGALWKVCLHDKLKF
jgi:hypothetical protein